MLDTSLLCGGALLAGGLIPLNPRPVLLALAVLLLLLWTRAKHWQLALVLLLAGLGAWRSALLLAQFDQRRAEAWEALGPPTRCSGQAIVRTSPQRVRDSYSVVVEARQLDCEGKGRVLLGSRLRLYSPSDDLARGDECYVVASLGVLEIPRNEEIDTARPSAARTGVLLSGGVLDVRVEKRDRWSLLSWIDRARRHVRRRIEATYLEQAAPLARALVLGENDLEESDAEAFRVSGLTHILAVSGTHIVIAVFSGVQLLHKVLVRREWLCGRLDPGRIASAFGVPLAWAYAEFAGAGGSVRRAAIMATVALLARALARQPRAARSFGLSLVVGAALDPLAVCDFSFGLSAAATAGLLVLSRPLESILSKLPRPFCWGAGPLSVTLAATLLCAPWLVLLSTSLSPIAVVANIVAVPIGEAVSLPACLGHVLLGPFPLLEQGAAFVGSASLLAVRTLARLGALFSWLSLPLPRPTGWHLCILAILGGWFLIRRPRELRDRLLVAALGATAYVILEVWTLRLVQPRGKLRITFLDVGQGDSALLDLPDGRSLLIDGGGAVGSPVDPGKTIVGPLLRARRRSRVDIGVLSHPHPDHFIGLASALPGVAVGEFWDTGQGEVVDSGPVYRGLLTNLRQRRVPVKHPEELCARPLRFGAAEVRVLGPCPTITPYAHANDNSFVLRVSLGDQAALLVGDAEHEQESRLLALGAPALRAQLLKVGHHGSRTSSSPEFLQAVQPALAVISCGVRNRFGHPHPHTLETFASHSIPLLRTDRVGSVRWETDGVQASVHTTVSPER